MQTRRSPVMCLVRLVLTQAILGCSLLPLLSTGRFPTKVCHRAECGGGGGMLPLASRFEVSGGVDGGGDLARCKLPLDPLGLLSKVRAPASGCVHGFALYSQHGRTKCPEGAISPWKLSDPGGNTFVKS